MSAEIELIAGARDLSGGTFADGYGEAASLAWPKDIVAVSDTELWIVEVGGNAGAGRLRSVTLSDPDAERATVTTLQAMSGGPSTVSYHDGDWAVCRIGSPTNSTTGRSGGGITGSFGSISAIHPPHTVEAHELAGSVSQPSTASMGPGGIMLVVESAIYTGSATDNIISKASWFNGGSRGSFVWNMGSFFGADNVHYLERSDGSGAHYGNAEYWYFRVENGGYIGDTTPALFGGIIPPPNTGSWRAWRTAGSGLASFGGGFDHLDRLIYPQGSVVAACPDPGYGPLPADWPWGLSGAMIKPSMPQGAAIKSLAVTPNGYIYLVTAPLSISTGPANPGGTRVTCNAGVGHGVWRIKTDQRIKPGPFTAVSNLVNELTPSGNRSNIKNPSYTTGSDVRDSYYWPYEL